MNEAVEVKKTNTNSTEEVAKLREELHSKFTLVSEEIEQMRAMQNTPPLLPSAPAPVIEKAEDGIEMIMYGPVCCPKCDLLLEGYSATGERTRYYKHPYTQSPKLQGQACEFKGMTFEPPKIILKAVQQQGKRV